MLDGTIVYPQGVPTFWEFLCGRSREVVVSGREVPLPAAWVTGGLSPTTEMRQAVQEWLNEIWLKKDKAMSAAGTGQAG